MSEMHVTSIAPWVGSNAQMVKQIIHQIGPHRAYWEVFLGGGSVLLAKEPCQKETVNDVHPELMNLIAVLASKRYEELENRLAGTMFSERIFLDAISFLSQHFKPEAIATSVEVEDHHLDWAWASFVKWWMGKGGTAGGPREGETSIRYDSRGGSMPSRFRSACKSVRWLHERLERVGSYRMDTFDLLPRIEDREGTVIYADPTFIGKDDLYTYSLKSGCPCGCGDTVINPDNSGSLLLPSMELRKGDDHTRLAGLLRRFQKTRVVLRYYEHPRLNELYKDWAIVDCTRTKQIAHAYKVSERQNGGEHRRIEAPDILLINQLPFPGGP